MLTGAQTSNSVELNIRFQQEQHFLLVTLINLYERNLTMNKDQVEGIAKDLAGKVQEEVGKLVGSKEQEAKGLGKQISGNAQKIYGDAKEIIKDASNNL